MIKYSEIAKTTFYFTCELCERELKQHIHQQISGQVEGGWVNRFARMRSNPLSIERNQAKLNTGPPGISFMVGDKKNIKSIEIIATLV